MRRWLVVFALCTTCLLLWPLVHGFYLENRICSQIRSLHGPTYGIIAMNVRGRPAQYPHIHFYQTLWEKSNLAHVNFDDWGLGAYTFPANHVIVLVEDAGQIHRYHWSFRENALVRQATADRSKLAWERDAVDFTKVEIRNGLRFYPLRVPSEQLDWFF